MLLLVLCNVITTNVKNVIDFNILVASCLRIGLCLLITSLLIKIVMINRIWCHLFIRSSYDDDGVNDSDDDDNEW